MTTKATPQTPPTPTEPSEELKPKARRAKYTGNIELLAVDNEAPVSTKGADLAPYLALVTRGKELYDNKAPKQAVGTTIIADSAAAVESRLRAAAGQLGVGLKVVVIPQAEADPRYNLRPDQARLQLTVTARRVMKPRVPKPETD